MGHTFFDYDERLGIHIPHLLLEWEEYTEVEQMRIWDQWETIRSRIPDRIIELEAIINRKQAQLGNEEHFPTSCQLNSEIASLASTIHDLNIWYRLNQDTDTEKMHG